MGLLARWWAAGNAFESRLWPGLDGSVYSSEAGESVSATRALSISTVYRAVNVLAAAVAVLPLDVYEPLPRGKRVAEGDKTRRLLRRRPNRLQTSFRWRHHLVGHVLLGGNYYAQKVRDADGNIVQLFPISPDRIELKEVGAGGEPVYEYRKEGAAPALLGARDVLHVRGFSLDGARGVSVLELMREHVGQGIAAQRQRSNFVRRELRPSVVVKHPAPLTPVAEANIIAGYQKSHGGPGNVGGVFVLGEGADVAPFQMSNRDAQWVEGESFRVEDFLRFLGVPGVLVGHADKTATYASAESFFQSFVTHSVWPITGNLEDELSIGLYDDEGDEDRFVEFNLSAMMRPDSTARSAFYRAMVELGILTRNEVRALENRNPLDGLDEPLTPSNMTVGTEPEPEPEPAPAPPAPATPPADEEKARALGIVRAAAARVVRREVMHLAGGGAERGLAARFAGDPTGWRKAVTKFYGAEHADFARSVLGLPPAVAARYCSEQAASVLAGGVGVVATWEADRVPYLERLALTGGASC